MRERMTRLWLLMVPLVALLAVTAGCGSTATDQDATGAAPAALGQRVETEGGFYVNITPQELQSMLSGDDFLLVNVYAGDMGEIEGTDLFIPYDQIAGRQGELPSQHDSQIVLYCRRGRSSVIAATTLLSLGYTDVWNLDGGMIAWEEAGYPLQR
jgi:rhodanese-related sulfurtransferase